MFKKNPVNTPKKVITVGAAIVDLYVESSEFQIENRKEGVYLCQVYGAKLEMDNFEVKTGGGASNVAVGLTRLGLEATMISELGQDFWSTIALAEMQKEGVKLDYVVRERMEQTGKSVILLGADGGRTVIVDRGASALLDGYDIPSARIAEADWLHFTSVNGAKSAINKVLKAMTVVKNVGFSWNPGGGELKLLANDEIKLPKKFKSLSVFLVNKEEWQVVKNKQKEIYSAFDWIIVTDGEKGGTVWQNGKEKLSFTAGDVKGKVIDATGAGDAFATGLVYGILQNNLEFFSKEATAENETEVIKKMDEICKMGAKNASSVVRAIGAKTNLLKKLSK